MPPFTFAGGKAWRCHGQTWYLWRQRDREGRETMGRFLFLSLGLLVVAVSLSGIGAHHHCPWGWISFDLFCYKIIRLRRTWADAEAFCVQRQDGSHLASIQSKGESSFLAIAVSGNVLFTDVWIGLKDPEKTGTWEWSDGSRLRYTSWVQSEPNNLDDKENCVGLSRESRYFRWKDINCESKLYFLCKFQPKSE